MSISQLIISFALLSNYCSILELHIPTALHRHIIVGKLIKSIITKKYIPGMAAFVHKNKLAETTFFDYSDFLCNNRGQNLLIKLADMYIFVQYS